MSKLNMFAVFGILFLSSILLANGMYSNCVPVLAQQENEAEVNADIEQENKCKKDTECENENKINNSLNIVNNTIQSQQPVITPTCEDCFTDILSEDQITSFIAAFVEATGENEPPFTSIEDVCNFIDLYDVSESSQFLDQDLYDAAFGANDVTNENPLSQEQYDALIQCLQDAGLDVDFPQPI